MVDDRLRILDAVKKKWKGQGYDRLSETRTLRQRLQVPRCLPGALTSALARVGDLLRHKQSALLGEWKGTGIQSDSDAAT
jgi:hypothetical protein